MDLRNAGQRAAKIIARWPAAMQETVGLTMTIVTIPMAILLVAILIYGIATGTITAATTVSLLAAALTLVYVVLTYLLLRQQHDDRRQAARPFLWCHAQVENEEIALTIENGSEVPAVSLRILAHIEAPGDSRSSQDVRHPGGDADNSGMLARRGFGALAPGYGVRMSLEFMSACDLYIFLFFETQLGQACVASFGLGRFPDTDAYQPWQTSVSPARTSGAATTELADFNELFDELVRSPLPEDVRVMCGKLKGELDAGKIKSEDPESKYAKRGGTFFLLSTGNADCQPNRASRLHPDKS